MAFSESVDMTRGGYLGFTPELVVFGELGWFNEEAARRRVYRWRKEGSRPFVDDIIDALDSADVDPADVYPELAVDIELEPDATCPRCNDVVTPIAGRCPWCDSVVR